MTIYKQRLAQFARAAAAIAQQFQRRPAHTVRPELPCGDWQRCASLRRKLKTARDRGWHFAASRIATQLREAIQQLQRKLNDWDDVPCNRIANISAASVREICADLIALQHEFDEVAIDLRKQTLSVITDPIELRGVYLGSFRIRLDWSGLTDGSPSSYVVIAMDPHPAAANDGVTHPHIQDETVCEGNGKQAIHEALAQGRLLDFFQIVASLLQTYNASSPYISLSQWHGVPCADCDGLTSPEASWTCERCESTICGDCRFACPACDGAYCSECVTRCEACDDIVCDGCVRTCTRCRAERCENCLTSQERCSDCHEETTTEENQLEQAQPHSQSASVFPAI